MIKTLFAAAASLTLLISVTACAGNHKNHPDHQSREYKQEYSEYERCKHDKDDPKYERCEHDKDNSEHKRCKYSKEHKGEYRKKMMKGMVEKRKTRMKELDTNGDGKIDLQEHLASAEKRFNKMDIDGDGYITDEETREAQKMMREKIRKGMGKHRKADTEAQAPK